MGDQERKIQEIGLWWGECEGVDWRALWGLGVVNGLGSYEVKVRCVEMEIYVCMYEPVKFAVTQRLAQDNTH